MSALSALTLLGETSPEALEGRPDSFWHRWLPVLFWPQCSDHAEALEGELCNRAYRRVPDGVIEYLISKARVESQKHNFIFILDHLGVLWDERIEGALFGFLPQLNDVPKCWSQVMNSLLEHGCRPAFELCRSMLTHPLPEDDPDRKRTTAAGRLLVLHAEDAAWHFLWPLIQADARFGRELMMAVAHEGHGHHDALGAVAPKLTEQQLGELYLWLFREFPPRTDPRHDGAYSPTGNDSVREFRDAVLNYLENCGTIEAVHAVERIADTLNNETWLRSVQVEARRNTLRKTWQPCSPVDLLELALRPGCQLVRNATDLQDAILGALALLEQRLQGETPAAPELWNEITTGVFKPKDENHFSDWTKRHLEDFLVARGVVVAREVEIRRGEGAGKGEETDIHVTALVPAVGSDAFQQVRVIIEVKGCWHSELKTAMRTQLVERYLRDNQCRHGIYLVGWFVCEQWDKQDHRKRSTINWSLDGARLFLNQQAADLSKGGLCIRAAVINAALR